MHLKYCKMLLCTSTKQHTISQNWGHSSEEEACSAEEGKSKFTKSLGSKNCLKLSPNRLTCTIFSIPVSVPKGEGNQLNPLLNILLEETEWPKTSECSRHMQSLPGCPGAQRLWKGASPGKWVSCHHCCWCWDSARWPKNRSGGDFLSYFCFHILSCFTVSTVSRLSHRDKTGTCNCHQHVPVYVYHLGKAGCRTPEAVVTFAFPLQAQAKFRHHKSHQVLQQEISWWSTRVLAFLGQPQGLSFLSVHHKEILWDVILLQSSETIL